MMFPPHVTVNPFGPHASRKATPDVSLAQFGAAQNISATHLSADGKTAYDQRKYGLWYCKWDEETKRFGAWWRMDDGLTPDAVRM